MLEINKLQKKYENFELNCSMKVEKGYITALVGENGAGKSTTFKALLGLIKPDGGEITIFGKKPLELTAKDRAKMGIVLTDSGFSGYLKVKDIIPVMESLYTEFEKSRFLDLCNKLDIPLNKSIKEFSTGMKAKLKVLCALTHKAKFLLLDEPTAGLDVMARESILNLFREYMEEDGERTILISSHISSDLEGLCDDIYMIHEGRIIFHEDTDVLLNQYGLLKVDEKQFEELDRRYLLKKRKAHYGISLEANEIAYRLILCEYIIQFTDFNIIYQKMDDLSKFMNSVDDIVINVLKDSNIIFVQNYLNKYEKDFNLFYCKYYAF